MSVSGLFDIGRSALTASQAQLGITGQNIANANTPGYSRQEVILEIATPLSQGQGFIGQGVTVAGIKRIYSNSLLNQINQAQQDYGKSSTLSQTLSNVEQIFNEAQNQGLAAPLADFFNAWQEVANNPQGLTERNLLMQKAEALVSSAKRMEQGINSSLRQTQTGIADAVTQVNALAFQIARLNGQILQMGNEASIAGSGLRDQRDAALKKLGNLTEMSSWEDKGTGMVTVAVGGKTLVEGNTADTLSTGYDTNGDYTLQLGGQDITASITKGEIGGLLTANHDIRTHLQDLRTLVANLVYSVNQQHALGYDLDGNSGTDFFVPFDPNVQDLSKAITSFGLQITDPRKIAASDDQAGSPGNNANALKIAALADSNITALGDTFSNFYQGLVGRVGNQSRAASEELTFSNNLLTQLNTQRDSLSGVNMDEEAANLIRFQRAYEAGARLISTADELLKTILNM
jgi:flagellar hook-associated protein 1 FlgK